MLPLPMVTATLHPQGQAPVFTLLPYSCPRHSLPHTGLASLSWAFLKFPSLWRSKAHRLTQPLSLILIHLLFPAAWGLWNSFPFPWSQVQPFVITLNVDRWEISSEVSRLVPSLPDCS